MLLRFNVLMLQFITSYNSIYRGAPLFLLPSLLTGTIIAQNDSVAPGFEIGKPIERELTGDQAHSYRIVLTESQFLRVVVDQRGIDIVVTLFTPDGKKLLEVDSPNGMQGPEPVSLIAEVSGDYTLEVRSLDKGSPTGRYEVKIEELRGAVPQDKSRITAERASVEALQLRGLQTKESYQQAIVRYEAALRIWRELKDQREEALTLNSMAVVFSFLNENQKSLTFLNQALPLYHALGDRRSEAEILNDIGVIYSDSSEKRKALEFYDQALSLYLAIGDRYGEAQTLNNFGVSISALGDKVKALEYLNRALPIFREVGDRTWEAIVLSNLGEVYDELGEYQKALDSLIQGLALTRTTGDQRYEASTLNTIGMVYLDLGQNQKALDYFNQALPVERAIGDRYWEGATLSNLGRVYLEAGENRKALEYFSQAALIEHEVGNRLGEAIDTNNIGRAYFNLGEKKKALDYYGRALQEFRDLGNQYLESIALSNIGLVYFVLGERQKALENYTQALQLSRKVGNRNIEAQALYGIARNERDRGNLKEARHLIERALEVLESLRSKIGSHDLRASFFATVQEYYEFYIDLLMRLDKQRPAEGYDGEALQASERGRARSLLEILIEARADIRQGIDSTLVERELSLQRQIDVKARLQMKVLGGQHTEEQTSAVAKELGSLTTEFQQIEAEIRQKSPNYAALTQPQPLSLKEIQTQVLDKDTLLLEYSISKDRSYLWAVTSTGMTSFELPKRDVIETAARHFYELLNTRNKRLKDETKGQHDARVAKADMELPSAGSTLSRMVLAPAAAQIGKKRLVIVADGVLQYIPFAALPVPSAKEAAVSSLARSGVSGNHKTGARTESRPYESNTVGAPLRGRPLIVDHEIISLPSASTLAVLRREVAGRKPAPKTVVALADPVFTEKDERVKSVNNLNGGAVEASNSAGRETVRELQLVEASEDTGVASEGLNIPRIPGSRREAEEIVAMVPASESKLALDFDANRTIATSEELSQYRYVHFSTHGFLNSMHPELSGLVFSLVNEKGETQDGFLRAHEVFNLKLPAELVVLSACQTGIGKEVKGEGLVSLTRGFMYAGAPRVVVSLWSVSEMGTTELMVRFYREMLKKGLRPAAALRAAQISLMKEKRWQSPFYWAPFTLQGEWR